MMNLSLERVSRKNPPRSSKNTLSISSGQTRLELKREWTLWSDGAKKELFAANPPHVFGANRVKNYTAVSLMMWAYFYAGGHGHLVQIHTGYHGFWQIPTDKKNKNLTASARNLIMGRRWIFYQDNNPKQTSGSTQKYVNEHKIKLLA